MCLRVCKHKWRRPHWDGGVKRVETINLIAEETLNNYIDLYQKRSRYCVRQWLPLPHQHNKTPIGRKSCKIWEKIKRDSEVYCYDGALPLSLCPSYPVVSRVVVTAVGGIFGFKRIYFTFRILNGNSILSLCWQDRFYSRRDP